MRIDCLGIHDLPASQRWLPWSDLPILDKYVLQFAEKRFDQKFRTRQGHEFRLVYDGRSIRVPFAVELDEKSRRKLDGCEGVIADMEGQNALYYSDLYELEMAWFTLSEGRGC